MSRALAPGAGRMSKRPVRLVLAVTLFAASAAIAADLRQATQLLDRNYYESAAGMLRAGVSGADASTTAFLLGRAYARSAELYRTLQRSSLAVSRRYLERLVNERGRDRSRYAALYLGEVLLESGNAKAGIFALRRFAAHQELPDRFHRIARVEIAQATGSQLPAPDGADADALSQLAAAMARTPERAKEAAALTDRTIANLHRKGTLLSMRLVTNAIGVYARAGESDKAMALIAGADLGRPSHEETIGSIKSLRFYDAALLGNLALAYQAAAERALEQARANERLRNAAAYFLSESYLASGQPAKAAALLPALATATDLPQAYRDRVAVMQAAADASDGRAAAGNAAFAALARRYARDPVMLGEALQACVQARAACDALARTAQALAEAGQGERFRGLHRAVGTYQARAGHSERALLHLELARDKSNKNKIDTNDPLLLIQLADLYLATRSYSENLEIYFELSKEFPAVRQLQEAGQGVYSMEFRSAGDVKIF
jgi:hypothetical protein